MAQMKKTAAKKPTAKPSTIQQVAKRFGITAREVRDIATAASTVARTVTDSNISRGVGGVTKKGRDVSGGRGLSSSDVRAKAGRNLAKQVGEVYTAATKGKSGTQSAQIKSRKGRDGQTYGEDYALETKRKQGSKK